MANYEIHSMQRLFLDPGGTGLFLSPVMLFLLYLLIQETGTEGLFWVLLVGLVGFILPLINPNSPDRRGPVYIIPPKPRKLISFIPFLYKGYWSKGIYPKPDSPEGKSLNEQIFKHRKVWLIVLVNAPFFFMTTYYLLKNPIEFNFSTEILMLALLGFLFVAGVTQGTQFISVWLTLKREKELAECTHN